MANSEHVQVLLKGAEAIRKWRREHPGERLDLSCANLGHADLSNVDLQGANLVATDLSDANLRGADLSEISVARPSGSDLANFTGANLSGAKLPSNSQRLQSLTLRPRTPRLRRHPRLD